VPGDAVVVPMNASHAFHIAPISQAALSSSSVFAARRHRFVGISIAILGGPRVFIDLYIVVKGDVTVREGHLLSHKVEDEILIEPEEELTIKTERKRIVS
jgi:divalent metal cation (Fe/Co/Zn/Cd) transporter